MILAAVVVAKDGSDTGGKAKVDRGQQPLRIQSDGDSSDAGFSQIVQHGQIKEEGGHCVGKIGDHFRGTVGADVSQCGSIKYRLYKKEAAAPINKKEDQTKDGGNTVADSGSIGGAFDAERKDDDKQKVKKDVGDTGKDGDSQSQMRSAGSDEKGLKIDKLKELDNFLLKKVVEYTLNSIYINDLFLVNDKHTDLIIGMIRTNKSSSSITLPGNYQAIKSYNYYKIEKINKENAYEYILEDEVILPNHKAIRKVAKKDGKSNNIIRLNSKDIVHITKVVVDTGYLVLMTLNCIVN